MGLLLIDNYDSFTYNLLQLVREQGCKDIEVIKYGEVNSGIVGHFDKILISPGPGTPDDFPNLEKWIREFESTKSILGICLGHDAIARAYNGNLRRLDGVFHGVPKKMEITGKDEYLFKRLPRSFLGGLYHSWVVDDKGFPENLQITAKSTNGEIMALAHKDFDVHGLQFHPESIMTEFGGDIIGNWLNGKSKL
ncbi:MAG: aminodeoxychorismate/anthranilate synthase component II [Chlorobi bacterium]|nr:aminodeoxychorismate/anthranilate synthase component II [Chlorobiota bacterium]